MKRPSLQTLSYLFVFTGIFLTLGDTHAQFLPPIVPLTAPTWDEVKRATESTLREIPADIPGLSDYTPRTIAEDACWAIKQNTIKQLKDLSAYSKQLEAIHIVQYSDLSRFPDFYWGDHLAGEHDPKGTYLNAIFYFKDFSTIRVQLSGIDPRVGQSLYSSATWIDGDEIRQAWGNANYFKDIVGKSWGAPVEWGHRIYLDSTRHSVGMHGAVTGLAFSTRAVLISAPKLMAALGNAELSHSDSCRKRLLAKTHRNDHFIALLSDLDIDAKP